MLYLLAGVLLGSAFLHPLAWVLVVPGVVALCAAVAKTTTLKTAFIAGFLAGILKYLLVISWFWTTYPLDWMAIGPIASVPVIFIYWFMSSAALAFGFGVSVALMWLLIKHVATPLLILIFPVPIVIGEVLGSFFFSVQTYGPNGSGINAFFSYGYLGYALEEHGILRYLGVVGGVYTLTFIVALMGVLIYVYAPKLVPRMNVAVKVGAFTAVLFITGFVDVGQFMSSRDLEARVALVGTSFAILESSGLQNETRNTDALRDGVELGFSLGAEYVILPEEAGLTEFQSTERVFEDMSRSGRQTGMLIDSYRTPDGAGNDVLRSFTYDLASHSVYTYDKRYLVPQGEYVPTMYRAIFWLFGQVDFFDYRSMYSQLHVGERQNTSSVPEAVPAVMFCSESIAPITVARAVNERFIPFVAHPISLSWFRSPYTLHAQSKQMVALQALSNNTYIFQAGNVAPTMAFDAFGRVIAPTSVTEFEHTSVVYYDL